MQSTEIENGREVEKSSFSRGAQNSCQWSQKSAGNNFSGQRVELKWKSSLPKEKVVTESLQNIAREGKE